MRTQDDRKNCPYICLSEPDRRAIIDVLGPSDRREATIEIDIDENNQLRVVVNTNVIDDYELRVDVEEYVDLNL